MFEIEPPEMTPSIVHEQIIEKQEESSWYVPMNQIAEAHLRHMNLYDLDQNWKLDEFFGEIYVINLPRSTKRLKSITEQLNGIGTNSFEVFKAIDGRTEVDPSIWKKFTSNLREKYDPNTEEGRADLDNLHKGEAGCYLSHYSVIKRAKEAFDKALTDLAAAKESHDEALIEEAKNSVRKYSRVLILEDDVGFGIVNKAKTDYSKRGTGKIFRKALVQLPAEWDILYFIVHPREPTEKTSQYLRRLKSTWCAAAYAVNYTMYGPLVEQLKKIEDPLITTVLPVDKMIGEIHHLHHAYAVCPSIVLHFSGVSYISSKDRSEMMQYQPEYVKGQK